MNLNSNGVIYTLDIKPADSFPVTNTLTNQGSATLTNDTYLILNERTNPKVLQTAQMPTTKPTAYVYNIIVATPTDILLDLKTIATSDEEAAFKTKLHEKIAEKSYIDLSYITIIYNKLGVVNRLN